MIDNRSNSKEEGRVRLYSVDPSWKAWGSEQLLSWWPGSRVTECQHKALRRQLWDQGETGLGTQLSTCKAQSSDPAPQKKQENKKHKVEPHSSELLKGYFVHGFGAGHWAYVDSDGICWGLMHCSATSPSCNTAAPFHSWRKQGLEQSLSEWVETTSVMADPSFHRVCLRPWENTDIFIMIYNNSKLTAMK